MDEKKVSQIKERLKDKETQELIEIWVDNDRDEYIDETFKAIEIIMAERNQVLPPQLSPISEDDTQPLPRSIKEQAATNLQRHGLPLDLLQDGETLAKVFLEECQEEREQRGFVPFTSVIAYLYAFIVTGSTSREAGPMLYEELHSETIWKSGPLLADICAAQAMVLRRITSWQDKEASHLVCDHCSCSIPKVSGRIDAYAVFKRDGEEKQKPRVQRLYCLPCYLEYVGVANGECPQPYEASKVALQYIAEQGPDEDRNKPTKA